MKAILLVIPFFLSAIICFGQADTTYFDKDWVICKKNTAAYYRLVEKDGTNFIVKDFFMSNKLQMIAVCSSVNPDVRNGKFTEFNERGQKINMGCYSNNIPAGTWVSYDENGKDSSAYEYQKDGTMFFLTEGKYVDLQGKKQFVMIRGKGNPTVVFVTGKGRSLNDFRAVYSSIQHKTQIFAYDRMGIGQSESCDNQRTVDTMAFELYSLLIKEKIKPPYILVGHSLGGYVIRCFANMYPKTVAGLIYVDPAYETEFVNCLNLRTDADKVKYMEKNKSLLDRPDRTKGHNEESKYCFDMDSTFYSTNQKIVKDIKIPDTIPITVFMSTMPDDSNPYSQKEMEGRLAYYANWKKQAPQLKLITTSKSGHFIQVDEPNLIIDGINEMLIKVKTKRR
jgi:pimeloyl-ACP methyl ester carboxylesterase